MTTRIMQVSIHDFWHCGSGRGVGSHVDARVVRDFNGLPHVPGRSLKGLLRDAISTLECLGDVPAHTTAQLFGDGGAGETVTRHDSNAGVLAVSDARLPQDIGVWLGSDKGRTQRAALFRNLYSTAIDPETGSARDQSLRGMEVAVPLDLHCELLGPQGGEWSRWLERAFPLVRAVGAHRQRGFGRCTLSWGDEK